MKPVKIEVRIENLPFEVTDEELEELKKQVIKVVQKWIKERSDG